MVAVGMTVRRRRELAHLSAWAKKHGWVLYGSEAQDLLLRLNSTALIQLGHTRRVTEAFTTPDRMHLLSYVCETGFEHRRQSHRWHIVVCEVGHPCGRATITAADWLLVAASSDSARRLSIQGQVGRIASVDDPEEWAVRLAGGLGDWFSQQPLERTWEILPGFIVGYEPRVRRDDALVRLVEAGAELRGKLSG